MYDLIDAAGSLASPHDFVWFPIKGRVGDPKYKLINGTITKLCRKTVRVSRWESTGQRHYYLRPGEFIIDQEKAHNGR